MTLSTYSFTDRDLEETAMAIKRVILDAMVSSDVIDEKTGENWKEDFAIMVRKPSFWKGMFNKKENKEELPCWQMVSRVIINEEKEDE